MAEAGTKADTSENFGLWLGQITRLWRAEIDRRLAPLGLTDARGLTLLHLSRLGELATQKELADVAGVQGPTLVRTLDWLEAEGLIERRPSATDRRSKTLVLTRQALPVVQRIEAIARDVREQVFAGIPDEDIATCLQVFECLGERLGPGNPAIRLLKRGQRSRPE